ncbi:MAG: WD40/YVTN/BNR-like repeat-containing protein [Thermoanaerobaculia bacterium]
MSGKILSIAITKIGRVLLGTEMCGVLFSDTLGPWQKGFDSGQTIKDIAIAPNGTIFAAESTGGGGVYRSTNEGAQWEKVTQPVSATAIAIDAAVDTILAGTTTSLLKSTDGGVTWIEINNINLHPVADLVVTPNSYWIALTQIDLFGSHAPGVSWIDWCCASASGLVVPPGPGFTSLVVHPDGSFCGSVFVTSDGNGVLEMPQCIQNNWSDYSKGLTDKRVLSSALFQNRPILVGTRSGVFREKL